MTAPPVANNANPAAATPPHTGTGAPGAPPFGALKPPPPPNPKIQAVTFAIELAKIRATTGVAGQKATEVDQLISDADAIAKFIGTTPKPPSFGSLTTTTSRSGAPF